MSIKPLVIYHAGCMDGFCGAWLFHHAFPDADFHPASYGEPPPGVAGRPVYIVDFSFKRPVLEQLVADARGELVVLDHHTSAEADLADLPGCVFDVTKSGGRIAWEFLWDNALLPREFSLTSDRGPYGHANAPWLVDYTEDRDLWRWALPLSREVNAALRSYPPDFARWDAWAHWQWQRPGTGPAPGAYLREFAEQGSAILRGESQTVANHVRFAREVTIAGHRVLCVNATVLTSEIAGELARGRPFGVCWFRRADGKYVYSLRSRDGGIDVSEVAKGFGGGGHARSAGFESPAPVEG